VPEGKPDIKELAPQADEQCLLKSELDRVSLLFGKASEDQGAAHDGADSAVRKTQP
jgi:hypothetical protein